MILKTDIEGAVQRLMAVQRRLLNVSRHREAPTVVMARCLVEVLDFTSKLDVVVTAAELAIPPEEAS